MRDNFPLCTIDGIIEPAFQPIIDIVTGEISHHESLLRIRQDKADQKHVEFLKLAESSGFIGEIDCAMLLAAGTLGYVASKSIGVNVSSLTLANEETRNKYISIMNRFNGYASRIVFEITETTPIVDMYGASVFLDAMRKVGGRIAIDDYGNGNDFFTDEIVSFLAPDFIKIDGRIMNMSEAENNSCYLTKMTSMAKEVGAELIAEFIDSEKKVSMLLSNNIRYAQGWLYGRASRSVFSERNV